MLVDHLTPGTSLHVPRAVEILPAMERALADARADGRRPSIYLVDHHEPGDPELASGSASALASSASPRW